MEGAKNVNVKHEWESQTKEEIENICTWSECVSVLFLSVSILIFAHRMAGDGGQANAFRVEQSYMTW